MGKIVIVWAVPLALLSLLLFLFPSPGTAATTDLAVIIQEIQPYGDDEVVTIVNRGSVAVDLTGWRLESSNSRGQEVQETFWFPAGCTLPPGGMVRIHSGPYARSWGEERCGYPQIDLAWTVAQIWSDRGDVAWLRDAAGNLVDLYTYGGIGGAQPEPTPPVHRPERLREGKRLPESRSEPSLECRAVCPVTRPCAGCCMVKVYLEAIELVYDHGLGCNWSFSASIAVAGVGVGAGVDVSVDPPIRPESLPQLLYRDVIPGEATLALSATAVEHDLWPDWGSAQRALHLCCPCYRKTERIVLPVHVVENECLGTDPECETLWHFVFRVELEPLRPLASRRPAPPATFEVTPAGPYHVGQEVRLSVPAPRPGWRYEWDFDGDGIPDATGPEARYRLHAGSNLITLIITDPQGNRSTVIRGLRVVPAKPGKLEGACAWLWLALPLAALGGLILWLA